MLIARGANVNARDKVGLTPLNMCIMAGTSEAVDAALTLIAAGADVHRRGEYSATTATTAQGRLAARRVTRPRR
jgi:ankyrin repeat protein